LANQPVVMLDVVEAANRQYDVVKQYFGEDDHGDHPRQSHWSDMLRACSVASEFRDGFLRALVVYQYLAGTGGGNQCRGGGVFSM
jgi:hypothetical protein